MRWSERSLTVGLCVSLLLHGAVMYAALGQYVRDLSRVYLSPSLSHGWTPVADVSVFNSPNAFGEDQGHGPSAQSETGDQPLIAPDGEQVQSLLSREAQGPPGRPGPPSQAEAAANPNPADQTTPLTDAASVMTPALADTASSPPRPRLPAIPLPAPSEALDPLVAPSPALIGATPSPASKPADGQANSAAVALAPPRDSSSASPSPASPTPPSPPSPPSEPQPSQPTAANPNPPSPSAPAGGGGGSPVPPGDSDSDPFNKSISVVIRPGGIDAHTGRKVRTVRPDLTLSAQTDLIATGGGRVQLAVRIDPNGNVGDVKVLTSSGNTDIDLPCVQAMHRWWIEPSRDKSGKAVSDVIIITITFQ
jgi:TonB family protein